MEEEHQIPQEISTYQFRLVGDMTLKQFFQVAAGALIALLIYSSNLPPYLKFPLIILSFLTGVAFAFFPLQDRPLSKWLVLFIKSIYTPTVFIWKKQFPKPSYFQPEGGIKQKILKEPEPITEEGDFQKRVSLLSAGSKFEELERKEREFLSKVSEHFQKLTKIPLPSQTTAEIDQTIKGVVPQIPVIVRPGKEEKIPVYKEASESREEILTGGKITPQTGQKPSESFLAQFSQEAAPPIPPVKANVIVGQVLDSEGKIIENAILEIRDSEGRAVRALKTNKLGHFMIVTPLNNGVYEIIIEKEGLSFNPLKFEAKGQIIPSIAIQAEKTKH
ncbi:hypothetical protein A2686_03305 [Candidatus Woesebacteria bacterium RIFCSPHIGHO2_01_FULL_38_10]|uniref:Uncharacterized protein n=1 Tax=Candidatus Woesebacteria bacterium RIFCSPLOWO2_01_FULL_39_10b TaxID=1802517 RepID=A0A1F8B8J3_9BACT|nr:MAG: hypothetical protein A2686_03305 [Candidatus Woesebacteria bacterium RIFCSPHIGHO2_01_FULL_38_10]OGM60352.1 MAG: hypothetical protein A2892_03375 [Candidatus Woesebacteria bacterium RIFCSPLOWO2_01_FULL_39_10b]